MDKDIKEDDSYLYIIDLLAHEYGWKIEYIQNLTMPEIAGPVKAIRERKNDEDLRQQMNINKGMSGKIGPNIDTSGKSKEQKEAEELANLAKVLKVPIKKVEENE